MAYLEITLKVEEGNRVAAAGVCEKYKQLFKQDVVGGLSPLLAAGPEVRIYETV